MESIKYSVTDGRAEIVLNNPAKLNAFDAEMKEGLIERLTEAHAAADVYSIVLTGAGRGFCSGADVSNMDGDQDELESEDSLRRVQRIIQLLYRGEKPTIAAINGPAVGAGCDFALACDLKIMSESALLRQQFVNIGLIPGDGGGWLLPQLVGEAKAKEFILTGRDISPSEALDCGLVMEVVEDGETLDVARDLADELYNKPYEAVRNAKQLIDSTQSYEEYAQEAIDRQWEVKKSPEHGEAVSAFLEGRDPDLDQYR